MFVIEGEKYDEDDNNDSDDNLKDQRRLQSDTKCLKCNRKSEGVSKKAVSKLNGWSLVDSGENGISLDLNFT